MKKASNVMKYSSPDIPNLWSWEPRREEVYALIEFEVGPGNGTYDVFSVVIATPEALQARRPSGSIILAERGTFVVSDFTWTAIRSHIEEIVDECMADDWRSTADRLQRHFFHEFEDYRP